MISNIELPQFIDPFSEAQARVDAALNDFFHIGELGLERFRQRLKKYWIDFVDEHTYLAAAYRYSMDESRKQPPLKRIAFFSDSERKIEVASQVIRAAGYMPKIRKSAINEYEYKQRLDRDLNPEILTMKVAQGKNGIETRHYPAVTTDVVVVAGDRVLEKPNTPQEAIEMMEFVSGKQIRVINGIGIVVPIVTGGAFHTAGAAELCIEYKKLTSAQVREYVLTHPQITSVAGAVDLSNQETRNEFINVTAPMMIRAHDHFPNRESFMLSSHQINHLNSYFLGVPTHPLNAMINGIRDVYDRMSFRDMLS